MKRLVTLGLVVCLALSLAGADGQTPIRASAGYTTTGLTVHGHAEIKKRPDVAYVSLGVVTQARDQSTAVSDNATRVQAVLESLKKSGIADKDVQTQYYTLQPQYDYNASPPVATGYQVQNTVRATIRDLNKAGVIVDRASTAGATQVEGLEFDLADRQTAEGEALSAAIANARSKADLMAGAAGVSLGRLISITEGATVAPEPIYMGARVIAAAAPAAPTTPISAQDITLTADVTLNYSISSAR